MDRLLTYMTNESRDDHTGKFTEKYDGSDFVK
jgi:hypothetical protein